MRQLRGFTLSSRPLSQAKRALAFSLVCVLALQSSASAQMPATAASVLPLLAELRFDAAQILASVQGTRIGALFTGNLSRWDAMHGPAPIHPHAPRLDPRAMLQERPLRPQWRGAGIRVRGPAMLDRPPLPSHAGRILLTPRRVMVPQVRVPIRLPAVAPGAPRRIMTVTSGSSNLTGINPWWTYEEGALPGVGKYMVNVANGNLIAQSNDVDIPERGIDLAFRRTYNSFSNNDWNASGGNDDGSPSPNVFGAGWTTTFGAHLALNDSGGISVFDIDGARYDYTPNGTGCFTPPPGMHNNLCGDGSGGGYFWYKKSGTIYYFYSPYDGVSIAGYAGRLYRIFGRNQNNTIQLNYSWAGGDSSTSANLTQIVAAHSDGQSLTLTFGAISGKVLLSTLTRPDGDTVNYYYDSLGDLTEVDTPGNGNGAHKELEAYNANHQLGWIKGPRWVASSGGEGGYTNFLYDASNRVTGVQLIGTANWTIPDGTGTLLQPGMASGWQTIAYTTFAYPSTTETSLTDIDGHATNWFYDSLGRVTQTQDWTGSLWLVTSASWDGNNNLTESIDARGYATDYAYDSNGNATAVALPTVTTNQGTFRPTSLYSYDRTNNANNIVQYCDPVETHVLGQDWTANPGTSDSLCPNQSGATRYSWDYSDGAEPFGRLSNSYTPLGYHRSFSYSTGAQGGDFGLPSDVNGDSMTQSDGTTRSPHQSFAYDANGNLMSYSAGVGSTTLSYDSLNRVTAVTDPDSVTARTCYYPNGQVQAKQSAAQYALDGGVVCGSHSVSFTYDSDGDLSTEIHHFGNQAGTTTKYYDGADRLVEVAQPHDSSADLFAYAWLTRYLYDLTQGNTVSADGATFHAYGNLFKTQEYLPSNPVIAANTTPASPIWTDLRGASFDALERPSVTYENSFGTVPKSTNTYDTNGYYGLLSQTQNAMGQQMIPSYTSTGWTSQKQYQNDGGVTPSETYTYDADGRATSILSSRFGTESLAYDGDGRLTTDADPTGGGYSSPATVTYGYYGDGLRQSLSVSSSAVTASNAFQYSYRIDGLVQTQNLTYPITGKFAWTYTNAGRELTQSDPYTGSVITLYTLMDNPTSSTRTMQAKTFTYDSYGQVASLVLPEGYTYGSFTYDTEGETTGYARGNAYCPTNIRANSCSAGSRTQGYSVRGELAGVGDSNQYARSNNVSADGTLVVPNGSGGSQDSFDARSGMMLFKYLSATNVTYAYDAAGRQTQVTNTWPYGYAAYATRSYDSENHLISQAYSGAGFSCNMYLEMCGGVPNGNVSSVSSGTTNTYAWGPNGHPIQVVAQLTGAGQDTASLHWDGDDILFGVNQNGLLDFEVGKLGSANDAGTQYAQGFHVTDRDMTGQAVSSHSWQEFGSWDSAPPAKQCGACSQGKSGGGFTIPSSTPSDNDMYTPPSIYLSGVRDDGYSDGFGNTFQGVRAYDGNLGTWTTPDAYAGDVHDPMSQKPFMWNRNNPLEYLDPSGYEGSCAGCQGMPVGGQNNQPQCDNCALYIKGEVSISVGPFSGGFSFTATSRGHAFRSPSFSGGRGGANFLHPLLGGNVTVSAGVIIPHKGKTDADVMGGLSYGGGAAAEVGGEGGGNVNGGYGGIVLSLRPFASVGASYGVQVGHGSTNVQTPHKHNKPH